MLQFSTSVDEFNIYRIIPHIKINELRWDKLLHQFGQSNCRLLLACHQWWLCMDIAESTPRSRVYVGMSDCMSAETMPHCHLFSASCVLWRHNPDNQSIFPSAARKIDFSCRSWFHEITIALFFGETSVQLNACSAWGT